MTRPGGFAWFGATLVWTGAAVMSFAGLDGLAVSCHIAPDISWLLPIVIDVGVAVAAWVWRRGVNPEASRLAGRMTWSLLVLTVLGNGSHLAMEASHVTPPWWVAAAVGAIPPAVAGAVAHLLVLLARTASENQSESLVRNSGPEVQSETPAPSPVKAAVVPRPKQASVPQRSDKTSAETKAAAAERSRRSRRHQAGDHSMCSPGRCPDVSDVARPNNGVKVEVPVS